jgi:WD40 repeat protein
MRRQLNWRLLVVVTMMFCGLAAVPRDVAAEADVDRPKELANSLGPAAATPDRFHAIYALPNDAVLTPTASRPDLRPEVLVPRIQSELRSVREWFATQTGNRRPRFVLGANGIEVTVVTIPVSTAELGSIGWDAHYLILRLLAEAGVLADNEMGVIYVPSRGPACGATTTSSIMYMDACSIYPGAQTSFPFGATYLAAHEMTHALGAVPRCAPHYDGSGHVNQDNRDVLYQGGGGRDFLNLMLDPGHDDYYGHGRTDCLDIATHPAWLSPGAGRCDGVSASTVTIQTSGSGPAAPPAGAGGFVGVGPTRLFDTRLAPSGSVCPGQTLVAQVSGRAGVPTSGVAAVVLNITATSPFADGYLSVWPAGLTRPNSSTLNFAASSTTANLVIATLSSDGRISLWNSNDSTLMDAVDVIVDVVGYLPSGSGFAGLTPTRILDSRSGVGAPKAAVAAGGEITLQVTGAGGVPGNGVSTVALNVTVTNTAADGYLSVWPSGQPRPNVSSVNFGPGASRANLVIVPVGPDGAIKLWNSNDSSAMRAISVIADVVGYFTTSGKFHAVAPDRVLDTRIGNGAPGPIVAGAQRDVTIVGRAGIPTGATAVTINVTATKTASAGYFTLWPTGAPRSGTSTVNWSAGQTVANAAIATIGADGKVSIWNANDSPQFASSDAIFDVFGYFT